MVALSQKEGGTLSLMSGSVCSQFGPHAQFWVRVGFFSSFFFFFLCFFFVWIFFFISAQTSCEAGRVLLYFLLLQGSCLQSLIDCGHLIPL